MKRLLLVLGSVSATAGALGLTISSTAIAGVVDGVMTYRVVNPPEPLPTSLSELGWVALSGMALAFGVAICCVATVMHDSQKTLSQGSKILHVVAGLMLLIGTMPLLWGIIGAKRGFVVIATSATPPTPESAREMFQAAAPALTVGSAVLLIGAVLLLVAGQVGLRTMPPQTNETRSMLGFLATVGCVMLAGVSSLLFAGVWLHGNTLETILAGSTSGTPKPSELAQHLFGILDKSLLAFVALACQAAMQIPAAISTSAKPVMDRGQA